jgi:hypothetical protein
MATEDDTAEVRRFFETYAKALSGLDLDVLVSVYRMPLPVVRPDRTRVIGDPATLRGEIGKILDFYRWSGMKRVEIGGFRVDGFDIGMHVVSLTWLPLNAKDEEIARIDASFAVRRVFGGARIAAVIAHNEERHRQPILRAAIPASEKAHEHSLRPIG